MVYVDTIGARLKSEIDANEGMTKAEIARRVGVTRAAIGAIVLEKTNSPKPETLLKICDEFGLNYRWLATGRGPRYRQQSEEMVVVKYREAEPARQLLVDVLLGVRSGDELDEGTEGTLSLAVRLAAKHCAPEKSNEPEIGVA